MFFEDDKKAEDFYMTLDQHRQEVGIDSLDQDTKEVLYWSYKNKKMTEDECFNYSPIKP